MDRILGVAIAFSLLGAAVSADAAGLTKKVYPTAELAARSEAANQMSKALVRYKLGSPISASELHPKRERPSPGGRALRFLVWSNGDFPGDMRISVRKLKAGGYKAYKGGTWVDVSK
jgi:hypothetical protein